ncbi:MAG: putative DNA binding domain-containing protein [Hoeflea sp.]|uniref:ATP-binding protein n=1 Tax=Hoeflea sp. TaxID=1940281 RepID=UPI001D4BBEC1|nr:ATP-binding protein [Hoeflea sp.]MBU4527920.1 putative DNA binding domain-containing protein [Alphaproteobacteria bacterium]MBU4546045.1 putative DNA binding domain-containing protein [Alphaproteobacteria bacterium]MBU4553270.1 putative DNA binding domain-containing protein [Alphaproteobacteria bacterium]MBV1724344.1 putative DNA binding domain-containing protein [Hoeflea sp.]MBV1763340.1 putative DNA binding domain-containing protein [Hoeflea sp.]
MAQQLSFLEQLERPTIESLTKPDQVFHSEEWQFVTRHPETTRFERKSARVDQKVLAKCLSAFGNGPAVEGGVVCIGIENDGSVTGCKSYPESKIQSLEYMGREHCPDGRFETNRLKVKNSKDEDDFIIRARVHYVENRLVELTDQTAYCRESTNSRKLTETEKQEIRINKGERAFELEDCLLRYPEDFRESLLVSFCNRVRHSRGGSQEVGDTDILVSMRLGRMSGGAFIANNVCALVFARDPRKIFPGAYVHFLRYEGTEERSGKDYNVTKDRILEGSILDIIKDTASTLEASLREFTEYRNGKFYQSPEYPRDAWYELLVNASVHRSYHSKNQPVFIKMFDNRLSVENPGGFMPSVTPENMFHKPRNPFLMFILREFGEVRCISEGTKRIRRELRDASLPDLAYYADNNSVCATLSNDISKRTNSLDSEAYKALGEAVAFSLDGDERKIINYVIEHGHINVSEALRILSTTYWHTAKAKMQRLVKRGILDFVSKKHRDPDSHYVLRRLKKG